MRRYARNAAGALTYRWLHPVSLLLYNFSFRSEPPMGHVNATFNDTLAGRTVEDLHALVDEVQLELTEPTHAVREGIDSPHTEAACRAFLAAVIVRVRGRLQLLAQLQAAPEVPPRTAAILARYGDAFYTNNAAEIAGELEARLRHASVGVGRSGWKDGNPLGWKEAYSYETWFAEIDAAASTLRTIDFAAHASRFPYDAQHERHRQLSAMPPCAVCKQIATQTLLTQRHIGWHLHYRGICAGNGEGDQVDDARASAIEAALAPPHSEAKFRQAKLYDSAGYCAPCAVFYCSVHWQVSSTGGGRCPNGHFKSLDPHWSPD